MVNNQSQLQAQIWVGSHIEVEPAIILIQVESKYNTNTVPPANIMAVFNSFFQYL